MNWNDNSLYFIGKLVILGALRVGNGHADIVFVDSLYVFLFRKCEDWVVL
jgi:hypothetical protein